MTGLRTMPHEPAPAVRPLRRSAQWRFLALAGLVFLCGTVTGGGVTYMLQQDRMYFAFRHPEHMADRLVGEVLRDYHLTPEQAAQVEPVIRSRIADLEKLRQEVHPKFVAAQRKLEDDVAALLTDEQAEKWHARFKEMRRSPHRRRHDGPKRDGPQLDGQKKAGGEDARPPRPGPRPDRPSGDHPHADQPAAAPAAPQPPAAPRPAPATTAE